MNDKREIEMPRSIEEYAIKKKMYKLKKKVKLNGKKNLKEN